MIRAILAVVVFIAGFVGVVLAAATGIERAGIETPPVGLNLMRYLGPQIETLAKTPRAPGDLDIAFLGDSISISVKEGVPVPMLLRKELQRDQRPESNLRLHSLAGLGVGPFDYFFLADEIARARPDVVVVSLSLNAFGLSSRALARERISGWIAPRGLAAAAWLPLHWIDLTFDDLLMNMAIVRLGGFEAWSGIVTEQARVGRARVEFKKWLAGTMGGRGPRLFEIAAFAAARNDGQVCCHEAAPSGERTNDRSTCTSPASLRGPTPQPTGWGCGESRNPRFNAEAELRHYGDVLSGLEPDHPVLEVLAAALDIFESAGIQTLVYVNPINVQHLERLDLLASGVLNESLSTIEAVVRAHGAEWDDLHALLPDASFRDVAGHFRKTAERDATAEIAALIAPRIQEIGRRARATQNWK